jgi:predicted DNA-binding transcriptional regulator YafY
MGMLDEMGIPIYSERGPHGGFSLVRGYRLPPLIFGAEEATVLYMGAQLVGEVWGRTYSDAVTSVTAKLDNVLPDDLRDEVAMARRSLAIGRLTAVDYGPWEGTIHSLRRCIGQRRCVNLIYRSRSTGEETRRTVAPYALTLQWGHWYLVGHCHLRDEMRTFRVDRIRSAEPSPETFSLPPDFAVREYLNESMRLEPMVQVSIELRGEAADDLRENHDDWMEVVDLEDGRVLLRFPTADLAWVTGFVLSFGPQARALEPPELVERVVAAARGAAARYGDGADDAR